MRLRGFGDIPFIDGLPGSAGHRWPQEESRHSTRQLRLGYDATRSEKLLKLSMRIFASKKTTLPISCVYIIYIYIHTYIYIYVYTHIDMNCITATPPNSAVFVRLMETYECLKSVK